MKGNDSPFSEAMQTATLLGKKTQREKEFRLWCLCCTDSSANTHFYWSCFYCPKYLLKCSLLLSCHLRHSFSKFLKQIPHFSCISDKTHSPSWRKDFSSIGSNDFKLDCI